MTKHVPLVVTKIVTFCPPIGAFSTRLCVEPRKRCLGLGALILISERINSERFCNTDGWAKHLETINTDAE